MKTATTPKAARAVASGRSVLLQRKCASRSALWSIGEHEKDHRQNLQRRPRSLPTPLPIEHQPSTASPVPPIVHDVLGSPGQPLGTATRVFMESRFGHDFSGVRIHSGAKAAESARAVQASAYTAGSNVVFAEDQYSPRNAFGRRLLAHELTHVVQQRKAGASCGGGRISSGSNEAAEREADEVARGLPGPVRPIVAHAPGPFQRQAQSDKDASKPTTPQLPNWTAAELGVIQARLKQLGLYPFTVDRKFGQKTEIALVEAFGGEEWRKLNSAELITRLKAAKRPPGKTGEHNLRYGEMFKDGLLDISLGVGFQEDGWGKEIAKRVKQGLEDKGRGFKEDRPKAQKIYEKTGHKLAPAAFGLYFVRDPSLSYSPPAAAERKVEVVARLISNADDKHGTEAASAFKEGMKQSDIAFYSGHGRVGSGPDFDPAMHIELFDKDGQSEAVFDDYEKFEERLKTDTKTNNEEALWQRFEWLLKHNRIKVTGDNSGNIFLNPNNPHPSEFLAKLMYWNLTRRSGPGATPVTPVTGKTGELNQAKPGTYRVWVFNGCRTQDYVKSIRSTPSLDSGSTDLFVTTRITYWDNYADTMIAFLDSVLKKQSAEQTVKEMDSTHLTARPTGSGGIAVRAEGLSDNPVIQ